MNSTQVPEPTWGKKLGNGGTKGKRRGIHRPLYKLVFPRVKKEDFKTGTYRFCLPSSDVATGKELSFGK